MIVVATFKVCTIIRRKENLPVQQVSARSGVCLHSEHNYTAALVAHQRFVFNFEFFEQCEQVTNIAI